MKSSKQIIFAVVLTFVTLSAGEDLSINDFCRFRVGQFAHPNPVLCYRWIQCQFIGGLLNDCGLGNIFVLNEGCVPGNRDTCERDVGVPVPTPPVQTIPPETSTFFQTNPPSIDDLCRGVLLDFVPDPNRCDGFILCLFEEGEFIPCPNINQPVFDPEVNTCVPGNPVTCEIFRPGQPTTTPAPTPPTNPPPTLPPPTLPPPTLPPPTLPPPTLPPPPTPPVGTTTTPGPIIPPPQNICNGNNGRFVADPFTCFRYYFCFLGIPLPGECDWNRIFVQRLQGCVLGNQQTCERNSNIINVTVFPSARPN